MTLSLGFLIAALVLFIVATIGWPSTGRVNLVSAGLACWVASDLASRMGGT